MEFSGINLKELFELMKEFGVKSLRLKDGKKEIEVKTESEIHYIPDIETAKPLASYPKEEEETKKEEVKETKTEEKTENIEENKEQLHEIKAPLVGTFYRAPAPGAEPFVEVGSEVKPGDTLCIVEAMKNMNEIESDIHGIVKEICVENAQLVEFGQVLFRIKPL